MTLGAREPYLLEMTVVEVSAERKAQLDAYAASRGLDTTAALDDVLADALAWDARESAHSLPAILRGFKDVGAGRTRPASVFLDEVRAKYEFPR